MTIMVLWLPLDGAVCSLHENWHVPTLGLPEPK